MLIMEGAPPRRRERSKRLNKVTDSCKGMHWLHWAVSSKGKGLLAIREKSFSQETHDEDRKK